jgi:redox-sensitive bicupin YhaK (pirin superfamily)
LKKGFSTTYTVKQRNNGVYVFVIDGEITVNGEKLGRRDGLGISETDTLTISADSDAEVLLMDVPMN